jgi:hypothetical protein
MLSPPLVASLTILLLLLLLLGILPSLLLLSFPVLFQRPLAKHVFPRLRQLRQRPVSALAHPQPPAIFEIAFGGSSFFVAGEYVVGDFPGPDFYMQNMNRQQMDAGGVQYLTTCG